MLSVAWHKSGKKNTHSISPANIEAIKKEMIANLELPIRTAFDDTVYRYTIIDNLYPDSPRIVWDSDTIMLANVNKEWV